MYDGTVTINTELETDDFEQSIEDLEKELEDLEFVYDTVKDLEPFEGQIDELKVYEKQIQDVNQQLIKMKGLQTMGGAKPTETQAPQTNQVEDYLASAEKKLLKEALLTGTILGTLYLSASALDRYLSQNEDATNKLKGIGQAFSNLADQIGNAVVNFIGPYIETFINWLTRLLGYLNVFIKAISGGRIDMSKSMKKNESATENTTKAIGKQVGAMKQLNKQLAKFDEATVLSDNKSGGAGGGGLDSGGLGIDDQALNDMEATWDAMLNPDKIAKIQDFAEKVKEAALWIVDPVGQAKKLVTSWKDLQDDLDNAGKKGEKYYEVQDKVKEISHDVNASIEQVTGALSANTRKVQGSHNQMQQNVNTIKDYGMVMGGLDYLIRGENSLIPQNTQALKDNAEEVQDAISNNRELIKNKKLSKEQIHDLIDTYIDERKELINVRNQLPKNSKAYQEVDMAIEMLGQDIRHYGDESQYSQKKMDEFWLVSKKGGEETATAFDKAIDKLGLFNKTSLMDKIAKISIETETNKAKNSLAGLANNVANSFQTAFNRLDLFASIRKQVNGMASDVAFSIRKVFGLAKGGIINLPGPGVPLTSGVVGGERAPEGVIPYTDDQVMETLGEAIGRHITINASITNSMNGRVISRELQKINNESEFGLNR